MRKILFTKYSNDRARALAIRTSILEEDGRRFVEKKNMFPEGEPHIRRQSEYYLRYAETYRKEGFELIRCLPSENGIVYDYIEGATLSNHIDALIKAGKKDEAVECVVSLCERIKRLYGKEPWKKSQEFDAVFGNGLPEGELYGCNYVNIDLVAENIILCDEKYHVMDYEWTFDFPVPALFVVFRVIYGLLFSAERRELLSEYALYNMVGITPRYQELFLRLEENFQRYAQQGRTPAHILYQSIGKPVRDAEGMIGRWKTVRMPAVYLDKGKGFNEEDKLEIASWKEEGDAWLYDFEVPPETTAIRLDPCSKKCAVTALCVNGRALDLEELETNGLLWNGRLIFQTEDPQIFIPLAEDVLRYDIIIGMNFEVEYGTELLHVLFEQKHKEALQTEREKDSRSLFDTVIKAFFEEGMNFPWKIPWNFPWTPLPCYYCFDRIKAARCGTGISLSISGWLFAENIRIDRGTVTVGKLDASVECGILRGDVKERYGVFDNAGDSGFSFDGTLAASGERALLRFYAKERLICLFVIDLENERILAPNDRNCPLISIIVPVYNNRECIEECVKRLCDQSYPETEIILVDDGSTDGSTEAVDSLCGGQVRALHKAHEGVSAARNAGLMAAEGKYIMFVDADDKVDKDMAGRLLKALITEQADVAACRYEKVYQDKPQVVDAEYDDTFTLSGAEAVEEINYERRISASVTDKLFRAECIRDIRFPEGVRIGEDYSFAVEALMKAEKVVAIPDILYSYIQRASSVCHVGFTQESYKILENYLAVYERQKRTPGLAKSAFAYLILQEMAIIVSMTRSQVYDKKMIKLVSERVRKALPEYLKEKQVPFYLKACSVMIAFMPRLFIRVYRIFVSKKRD